MHLRRPRRSQESEAWGSGAGPDILTVTLDMVLVLHNRTPDASHESVALFYHLNGVIPVDQPKHYHCFLKHL